MARDAVINRPTWWPYQWSVVLPLTGLWSLFALVSGLVWWRWGQTGWPVGSYWWDELALSGAAEAIHRGMVPTVDFWAPFILPLYLKRLAIVAVGHGGAYVLECLVQGLIVLLLFSALVGRKRLPLLVHLTAGIVVLSAVAPFNFGSVTEAKVGTVAFCGAYNRLGGALIGLVLMLPAVRLDGSRDRVLTIWLAIVFLIAILVKVTVFQIAWGLVMAWAVLTKDAAWWRILIGSTLLAVIGLLPLGAFFEWGRGYASALAAMSELRMQLFKERFWGLLGFLHSSHGVELFILLFAALLIVIRGALQKKRWVGLVSWYLLAVAMVCAYMVTNFGDNGLMPAVAALCTVTLLAKKDLSFFAQKNKGHAQYAPLLMQVVSVFCGILILFYGATSVYLTWALVVHEKEVAYIYLPVQATTFSETYVMDERSWSTRSDISIDGVPFSPRNTRSAASYVQGLDEANVYLSQHFPDRSKSVYALDFPSYVFSLMGGYRIPRHTYPWMLYGHEVTIDHHPKAEEIFSDVDIVMISKCSLSRGNKKLLKQIYRLELEAHWTQEASLRCWDIYRSSR